MVGKVIFGGTVVFRCQHMAHAMGTAKDYADYGGSASCRDCQPTEFKDWQISHHALAERLPGPEDVTACSLPRRFQHDTQEMMMLTNGNRFALVTSRRHGTNEFFRTSYHTHTPRPRCRGDLGCIKRVNFQPDFPAARQILEQLNDR
jgi:hypothetical protein